MNIDEKDIITPFVDFAKDVRPRVDAALKECFDRIGDGCPPVLTEAMSYSVLAPGKRLRPILTLLAADACGASEDAAMPAACAVEMIHAYSLIHDDLPGMDDDALRRGRPTCHIAFDEATAILAGDALQPLAFETIARGVTSPECAVRCCLLLARAAGAEGMVGGQSDDLAAEKNPDSTGGNLETLESIHRRKTGAMIRVSLLLGGTVADANPSQMAALEEYADKLGLAFQIVDDLLDAGGNALAMGKNVQKDASRGKLTYPGLLGVDESHLRARQLIEGACDAVAPFGEKAGLFKALAHFVLERDR